MSKKNVLFSGFMLFSLFFGAGNLIFPPYLGMESGSYYVIAIAGFILTAVFLPFLTIISVSLSDNGLLSIGQRVHPVFGLVFAIVIYMSIGAFYGIPRASSVAYELGFMQVYSAEGRLPLFLFSVVYFGVTYLLSINPKKIIDLVGQFLTPALLTILAILFIRAFSTFNYKDAPAVEKFKSAPFLEGFLEGYFTMDAVAALAFGIVIINGLKDKGATDKKDLIRGTVSAGLIAAVGLIVVYLSLSWIGRVLPHDEPLENGAEILVLASQQLFGYGGNVLFGSIVILACLTTCVGLTNACASFFNKIFPKLSYKKFVIIFIVIGMLFTNFGLDLILQIATPLLVFIYPISIVLVILSLFQHFLGESKKMYVLAVSVATLFALYGVLDTFNIHIKILNSYLMLLPLYENGLGWTVPTLLAAVTGYVIDIKQKEVVYRSN
ncbi:branched-chain amino acid transport system II carrier protein [Lysinibacillus sp. Ag94]|uniref:branched-chain amino acid transport system II carrier protein n=1 Tax=Lysinibacillus sp. Ag94 TaxID=2936682 RepID=UPI00200F826A|nr:branched-chain amino acid transport system II carrier protein [Lysinibacillus sp. Ag94]UPW81530.1 branched-chain amino acid transport system II carrier protein [Lysinibacillus sp. Ag94]